MTSSENKPLLMHIDDDDKFLKYFSLVFKKFFIIDSFIAGREALEAIKKKDYDAVITDYEMPEINGIQVLKKIKEIRTDIPVIFYTGQGSEEVAREAFVAGASDYFSKGTRESVHKEKIVNSIKNAIEKRRAKQALIESERRFRAVFDNSYQYTGLLTPGGKILEINRSTLQAFNLYSDQIEGSPFHSLPLFINEKDRELIKKKLKETASGAFTRFEIETTGPDGSVLYLDMSLKPVRDDDGNVILIIPEGRNITERKYTEKALASNEQQLRTILSSLKDTFIVVFDRLGNFVYHYIPDVFLKKYNFDSSDWQNHSLDKIFSRDEATKKLARLQEIFENRKTFEEEFLFETPGGSFWHTITLTPAFDDDGNVSTVIGFIRDIHRIKETEIALRKSEEQNNAILSALHETIITVYDRDGKYLKIWMPDAINKRYKLEKDSVIGKNINDIFSPHEAHERKRILEKIFATGQSFRQEVPFYCPGGEFWHDITLSPMKDNNGEIMAVVGFIRDITIIKHTEEALEKSRRKYQRTLESLHDTIIIILDTCRRQADVHSPAGLDVKMGIDIKAGMNKRAEELFMPLDAELFNKLVSEAEDTGKPVRSEILLTLPVDKVWFDVTVSPLHDKNGIIESFVVFLRDITTLKNQEKQLEESNKRYKSLFDNAPVGMATITREGLVSDINKKGLEIIGAEYDDIIKLDILKNRTITELGIIEDIKLLLEGKLDYVEKNYNTDTVWGKRIKGFAKIIPTSSGAQVVFYNFSSESIKEKCGL